MYILWLYGNLVNLGLLAFLNIQAFFFSKQLMKKASLNSPDVLSATQYSLLPC